MLLKEIAARSSKKTASSRTLPTLLAPLQILLVHGSHFIEHIYKYVTLFETYCQIRLLRWFYKRRGRFYSTDLKMLLLLHTSMQGILIKNTMILDSYAGLSLFASRTIRKQGIQVILWLSTLGTTSQRTTKEEHVREESEPGDCRNVFEREN